MGRSNFADGDNRYRPTDGLDSSGVIDELATLLTSGRLSQEKRGLLKTVYEGYRGSEAYINVQQLIATSPEFNANGLSRGTGQDRKTPEQTPSSASQFKAVVEIYLPGGWDSFSKSPATVFEGDERYRRTSLSHTLACNFFDTSLQIFLFPTSAQRQMPPANRLMINIVPSEESLP